MEITSCALCGSDDADTLFEGKDLWYKVPGQFPVRRCRECGLVYLSPRPSTAEIDRYYPRKYQPYALIAEDRSSRFAGMSQQYGMNKRVRAIESQVDFRGRALDIGCASGQFLEALRRRGWEVQGVETNEDAVKRARQRLGLDVFHGQLQEANFPDRRFDLVTMWHVLEHVHEPVQTLIEIARITRPGGVLFLTLPDPDSLEAQIFGRFWAGWDVPRHLHIFSKPVIERMLAETGWQKTETIYITGRLWLLNLSLDHWLEEKVESPKIRSLVSSIAGSLPAKIITLPYFMTVERLHKGSIMGVFATRV